MNILTFNQTIQLLKDFANNYPLYFFLGPNSDFTTEEAASFPALQVYIESARMPQNDHGEFKTLHVTLNCKVVDQTRSDFSNEKDVISDSLQIAQDLVNWMNQHPFFQESNATIYGDVDFSPLGEYTNDNTAGHEFRITLRLINQNTYCGLPFEDYLGYSLGGAVSTGYTPSISYLTCSTVTGCTTLQNYLLNNYLSLEGGILAGNLSGTSSYFDTIYLSGVSLTNTFLGINAAISSATTVVQNGLNTYVGGNTLFPTVNISAATLTYLSASTISGGTLSSGSTNLYNIFIPQTVSATVGFSGWTSSTGSNSIVANNGSGNLASGSFSLAGGQSNSALTSYSVVVGGNNNIVNSGYYSSKSIIVGGENNLITGGYKITSFIGGGTNNAISGITGQFSVIVGGKGNIITDSDFNFIGSGSYNIVSGNRTFIGGGFTNTASGLDSFIGGGFYNSTTGSKSFIGGGYRNITSGLYSTIVNGSRNIVSGTRAFIGNGQLNSATTSYSVVVGGYKNVSSGYKSFVGGGSSNQSSGYYSSVLGGKYNLASGAYSSVLNGSGNTVTGQRSAVIGGQGISGTSDDTVYIPNARLAESSGSKIYSAGTDLYNIFSTKDVFVTGGTYSAGTATFANNTGGTFSITGFTTGSTSSGGVGIEDLTFSGLWHQTPAAGPKTAGGSSNGAVWWFPYPIGKDRTVTAIGIEIPTGSAGQNIRLALYSDNGSGRPGSLIEESGNISAAASGFLTYTFSSPIALSASNKFYWLGYQVSSGAVTVRYGIGLTIVPPSNSLYVGVCSKGQAFGAFPATAAGYGENTSSAHFMIQLKVQ